MSHDHIHKPTHAHHAQPERGNILIAVLLMVIVMAGLVAMIQRSAIGSNQATLANSVESKLLYVAESGLNFYAAALALDSTAIASDETNFTVDVKTGEYVGPLESVTMTGDVTRTFRVRAQYLNGTTPVLFAKRSDPKEEWTRLKLTSTATLGTRHERIVAAWYRLELGEVFSGAIVSDSLASGKTGLDPKNQSKTGDVVFADNGRSPQQFLYGGIRANGAVRYFEDDKETALLTDETIGTHLAGSSGKITQGLGGTAGAIPNFTALGGANQLFDFDRFKKAALKGSGSTYNSLAKFTAACAAANKDGNPLEGIIVVNVNSASEGKDPQIALTDLPSGINVRGTLLFSFSNGTDAYYKIFIKCPLNINAADLTSFDPTKESTFTTGYPPKYSDANKAPWKATISPTYENFKVGDGMPAYMFDTGVIDIHDSANVCGVIYGPSFIEIENKLGKLQYFNGSIIGGAGVYLEGNSKQGTTAIRFDPNVIANLQTFGNVGKSLTRVGFSIVK